MKAVPLPALYIMFLWGMLICAPVSAFQYGVVTHVRADNGVPYESAVIGLQLGGFNAWRDDFFWHRLEVSPGKFKVPIPLQEFEQLVQNSNRLPIEPLVILAYGNRNYDNGDLVASASALRGYKRYVRFVVERLKPKVRQFEVWNEWNIGLGSPRKPRPVGKVSDYVRLLKHTRNVVKSVSPDALVVGGAVGGLDDKWIDEFLYLRGLDYVDVFSVHPYVLQDVPDSRPEAAISWLDALREKIDRAARPRDVPIWVTEIGWPTNKGRFGVTESVQANYFARFMLLARCRPWIGGVWWYDLIDDGADNRNKEHRFGLLRRDLTAKPAFLASIHIGSLVTRLVKAQAYEPIPGVRLVLGRLSNGEHISALWSTTDKTKHDVAIKISSDGSVSATGSLGQYRQFDPAPSTVSLDGEPLILVGKPGSVRITWPGSNLK